MSHICHAATVAPGTCRLAALAPHIAARSPIKEYAVLFKEHAKQEAKVEKMNMEAGGVKDGHDVRKQEEVLAKAALMIPDARSRLERGVADLQELLESKDCGYLGECDEVVAARAIFKQATR